MPFRRALDLARREACVTIGGDQYTLREPTIFQVGLVMKLVEESRAGSAGEPAVSMAQLLSQPPALETIVKLVRVLVPNAPDGLEDRLTIEEAYQLLAAAYRLYEVDDPQGAGRRKSSGASNSEDIAVQIAKVARYYGMMPDQFVVEVTWRQFAIYSEAAVKSITDIVNAYLEGVSDRNSPKIQSVSDLARLGRLVGRGRVGPTPK